MQNVRWAGGKKRTGRFGGDFCRTVCYYYFFCDGTTRYDDGDDGDYGDGDDDDDDDADVDAIPQTFGNPPVAAERFY